MRIGYKFSHWMPSAISQLPPYSFHSLFLFSERFQEDHQTLEEQCERRIEMLTRSMKKTRKRKKIDRMEDEDDSYVSSVLLHAEKIKVKVRFNFAQYFNLRSFNSSILEKSSYILRKKSQKNHGKDKKIAEIGRKSSEKF